MMISEKQQSQMTEKECGCSCAELIIDAVSNGMITNDDAQLISGYISSMGEQITRCQKHYIIEKLIESREFFPEFLQLGENDGIKGFSKMECARDKTGKRRFDNDDIVEMTALLHEFIRFIFEELIEATKSIICGKEHWLKPLIESRYSKGL